MKRIQSVDTFRLIAVVMVITLHTNPFRTVPSTENAVWFPYIYLGINNLARFAVPFFFVISGYFWGIKIRNGHEPIAHSLLTIKRIFIVFLFWNLIYLIPYKEVGFHTGIMEILKLTIKNIAILLHKPLVLLIMQGAKDHLWFLVSLMFSIGISAVFVSLGAKRSLVAFSLVLYMVGILATSYGKTPIGIRTPYDFDLSNRIGPFFSTIFFVSGYFMSRLTTSYKWFFYGLLVFIVGCIIQFSEIYVLWRFYGMTLELEFGVGTFFMGNGVAMVALSDHPILRNNFFSRIGPLVLGIYAVHYIFVDLFSKIPHSPVWEIGYVIIVFTLSLLVTYSLSKNEVTKNFVM